MLTGGSVAFVCTSNVDFSVTGLLVTELPAMTDKDETEDAVATEPPGIANGDGTDDAVATASREE